jgi:hypothetical protein
MDGGFGLSGTLAGAAIVAVLTVGPLWLVEYLHQLSQAAGH